MQVKNISQSTPNFTGLLNNKLVLKGLKNVSEHGTSFTAGTSLALSLGLRPYAIMSTPNVEKENKQYACANSICSGLVKFGIVESVAIPIENAVKKIDNNAWKYLKPETISNLRVSTKKLTESEGYQFSTQMIKLGTGFITAIPKSMLTIALIPIVMDKIFKLKPKTETQPATSILPSPKTPNIEHFMSGKTPTFKGKVTETLAKGIGKIIDNKHYQNFAVKHQNQNKDIAKHITAATDVLLTATSAYQTNKSSKIKENRKKALIYNNVISTAITLLGGYSLDNFVKKKTNGVLNKFQEINKADANLHKYIEGINIVRPAIIFAGIYYGILPIFSTFIAEKVDKFINMQNTKS